MINTLKIKASQLQLVRDIIAWGETQPGREEVEDPNIFRRSELKRAHQELRKAGASPYFIAKNTAAQVIYTDRKLKKEFPDDPSKYRKHDGYDLSRFLKFAEKHPPEPEEEQAPPKKKAKAKKKATKRARAPKKAAAPVQVSEEATA